MSPSVETAPAPSLAIKGLTVEFPEVRATAGSSVRDIAAIDEDELVQLRVGCDIDAVFYREAVAEAKIVLRLSG
jgi:hypothetical protein